MNTQLIYCQQCGKSNDPRSKFCHHCGAALSQQTIIAQPPRVPPQSTTHEPPPKKSRSCLSGCLIATLVVVCLGVGGLTAVSLLFGEEIMAAIDTILTPQPTIPGTDTTVSNPNNTIETGNTTGTAANSLSVTSGAEGIVTSANGARIFVPSGAVPVMDDGSAGTMVFSIEEDRGVTPSLPGEFEPAGPVYHLGPEGFVFTAPVMLTLPIPEDVDPELVLGLTFFDVQENVWKLLPGTVDVEARTVSAETTHFSTWGIFGSCFGGCSNYDSANQWKREHGGWIKVVNGHRRGSGNFPGGRNLPLSSSYGVCVKSYALDNQNDASGWLEPLDWKITAHDEQTTHYWLPAGRYELIKLYYLSEINQSPLYVPDYATYWQTLGTYTIVPGETLSFTANIGDLTGFTEGRPPCWGEMTTAVGTGDVQVTLTWQAHADIDLYVEDPQGETVFYGNDLVSSGGQLDRDNTCGDFIEGQPENVFWPEAAAPSGSYKVHVEYYGDCGSTGPVQWTVRTVVGGQVQTYSGTLADDSSQQEVTTFTIP